MEKPKKYFNNCGQEYVYTADKMDAYLDSLKVDREKLIDIFIQADTKYCHNAEQNDDVGIESYAAHQVDAIMSAIGGGE